MGFLDSLWDETLAGPAPDSGKLRKYNTLSSALQMQRQLAASRGLVADDRTVPMPISRRITVITHNSLSKNFSIEPPESPTGSESPGSPLSPGTPRESFKKLTRKRKEAYEKTEHTGYDWIVLSSLDR